MDHGTKLEVAYFDQLKEKIKDDLSVASVAPNGDFADQRQPQAHPRYLRDFLFS